jgi:hypothetical protein
MSQPNNGNNEASIPCSLSYAPSHSRYGRHPVTAEHQMLGTPNRPTHMNTLAIAGPSPMSNVVYGFRPEGGWAGVLFQAVLQGSFAESWAKQKDIEFWISFEGLSVKAVFHKLDSSVSLPGIGTKRYIVQCVAPDIKRISGSVPVTMGVLGSGGKKVATCLFMGCFQYKQNGILPSDLTN